MRKPRHADVTVSIPDITPSTLYLHKCITETAEPTPVDKHQKPLRKTFPDQRAYSFVLHDNARFHHLLHDDTNVSIA